MRERLLHDLLDRRAKLSPTKVAVTAGEKSWTYSELRQASVLMHGFLTTFGVGRGDRVLVPASAHPQALALAHACSRAGAIYVPISSGLKPFQLRMIAEDCTPSLLVVDEGTSELAAQAAPQLPRVHIEDVVSYRSKRSGQEPGRPISQDPIFLIYTSGSTGSPKGVISTHAQVIFAVQAIQARLNYKPSDIVLNALPLSFDYGLYQSFLATLAGATLSLAPRESIGPTLMAVLRRTRATVLPCVPSLAQVLRMCVLREGVPPEHLRMITNTGAAFPPTLVTELTSLIPGLAVVRMFGLTECKRVAIMPASQLDQKRESVGFPLDDVECFIVGDDGDRLPAGQVGELVVRGPNVMSGYWNAPELTRERFRRNEFGDTLLYTGDLCHIDEDGYLYHHGRLDDQYKENGVRTSAAELEAAAVDISGVRQAAALPPTADHHKSCLVVVGDVDLSVPYLQEQLRERLERDKLPKDLAIADALPLTVNGKIDKKALREQLHPARETALH